MSGLAPADVYQALKRDITHFRFKPGERLVEEVLSGRYGVSRTPVREAMRSLEQEGLLISRGTGRFVREFDVAEFEDIYRVRAAIESLSAGQAAERATEDEVADLRGWLESQGTEPNYDRTDLRFHTEVARLTRNAFLIDSLRRINDRIWIIRTVDLSAKERVEIAHREHLEIIDAISTRDGPAAGTLMRAHIEGAMSNVRDLVSRALAQIYLGPVNAAP